MSTSFRKRRAAFALLLLAVGGCDAFADPPESSGDPGSMPPGFPGPSAGPPPFPMTPPPPSVCPERVPSLGAPCFTMSVCTYPHVEACAMATSRCVNFRWLTELAPLDPCGPEPGLDLDAGADDQDAGSAAQD